MTLIGVWIRQVDETEELVVASDSRLNGGFTWDCGAKIHQTARGDSVLCFTGDTSFAYPIIFHVRQYIAMHPKAMDRSLSLTELKGHIVRFLSEMVNDFAILPKPNGREVLDEALEGFEILLAGYCWRYASFLAWRISFDKTDGKFTAQTVIKSSSRKGRKFAWVGNYTQEATSDLQRMLHAGTASIAVDMQPLTVMVRMLQKGSFQNIGGPPQVVKVYKHINTMPYNVFWPEGTEQVTYLGRRLLEYERNRYLTLNTINMTPTKPTQVFGP